MKPGWGCFRGGAPADGAVKNTGDSWSGTYWQLVGLPPELAEFGLRGRGRACPVDGDWMSAVAELVEKVRIWMEDGGTEEWAMRSEMSRERERNGIGH